MDRLFLRTVIMTKFVAYVTHKKQTITDREKNRQLNKQLGSLASLESLEKQVCTKTQKENITFYFVLRNHLFKIKDKVSAR